MAFGKVRTGRITINGSTSRSNPNRRVTMTPRRGKRGSNGRSVNIGGTTTGSTRTGSTRSLGQRSAHGAPNWIKNAPPKPKPFEEGPGFVKDPTWDGEKEIEKGTLMSRRFLGTHGANYFEHDYFRSFLDYARDTNAVRTARRDQSRRSLGIVSHRLTNHKNMKDFNHNQQLIAAFERESGMRRANLEESKAYKAAGYGQSGLRTDKNEKTGWRTFNPVPIKFIKKS